MKDTGQDIRATLPEGSDDVPRASTCATVVTVRESERLHAPTAPPPTLSAICTRTGPPARPQPTNAHSRRLRPETALTRWSWSLHRSEHRIRL
jgi:hypothetical protein